MSKGRLSRLTRSAPNLEIPANETRAEAVHHGLLAITIPATRACASSSAKTLR